MSCTLLLGECERILPLLADESADSLVTDPPAGIGFMGRTWDSDKGGRTNWIDWLAAVLRECLRILKPGGHALVWALPRTSHWTATAVEEAGFEIRDVHHEIFAAESLAGEFLAMLDAKQRRALRRLVASQSVPMLYRCFGCVPLETEILTERGWVTQDQLQIGERVVQVDEHGAASLGELQAVSVYPFSGEMRRITTRSTEQLLTPGHKVHAYARRQKWKRVDTDNTMSVIEADAFADSDHDGVCAWQLPLAARGAEERGVLGSVDVASLYGWVITEGNFQRDTAAVNIYQNEGPQADRIRALLARLEVPHSEYRRTRDDYDGTPRQCVQWYIKVGPWADRLRRDLAGDKPTPPQWLAWLPSVEALALFEALIDGDGSRNTSNSGAWYQKRPEVRAWFQSLCFRLGYRSTENASKSAVQWSRSDTTEVQRGGHRKRWASRVPFTGEVWCPTVPQGRWVARYRGNVFVTGNTGFPKSLTPNSAAIPDDTGTGLKPAVEHWILARKPLVGTVAENVAMHGTGVLSIDACRIGHDGGTSKAGLNLPTRDSVVAYGDGLNTVDRGTEREGLGRWPAHLSLDEHAARLLDEQSAARGMHSAGAACGPKFPPGMGRGSVYRKGIGGRGFRHGDTGGASRFFYVAKASRSERDAGLDDLPAATGGEATGREDGSAGTRNPRAGAGRTGGAKNIHPTCKPIALMQWLVRLVTPPGGLVLDPFAGSGTTGLGCHAEGMRFLGIEQEAKYHAIALARLKRVYGRVETTLPEQGALNALLTPRRVIASRDEDGCR